MPASGPYNQIALGGVIPANAREEWGNIILHQRDRQSDDSFSITFTPAANAFSDATIAELAARHDFSRSPPSVSVAGVAAAEGNVNPAGTLGFKLALSKAAPVPVTVRYETGDGTAVAGADYLAAAGEVTFAAGETEKVVAVALLGDIAVEEDETLALTLSSASGGVTIAQAAAQGVIANDDDPARPSILVNDVRVSEGGTLAFEVLLSVATTLPVTVEYATLDGTARAGSDHAPVSGTLSFAAGETSKTVTVASVADTGFESDETFSLVLSNPAGGTLLRSAATGTIANDDPVPAATPTPPATPGSPAADSFTVGGTQVAATAYAGPVGYLTYQFLGSAQGEVVLGTARNDFANLLGGDDACDAGAGEDVIDGGLGSNFLTGGAGQDVFFLDGRSGGVTWGTITDWQPGEQLSLFGWRPGVSSVQWVDRAGASGFQGVTLHADLDGNGSIDASVTWSNMTRSQLPTPTEHAGLLWFHP